jgi:hypothetical protein
MHGPTLPVAIFVSLHLSEARVLAQDRIHASIVAPGVAAISTLHFVVENAEVWTTPNYFFTLL